MMELGEKEGLVCEVTIDETMMHVSDFKYLEFVLEKSGTDRVECCRKLASWKKVADGIRSNEY